MTPDELLEMAWVIMANAADWLQEGKQYDEWVEAAEKWRNDYFATLKEPSDV